jgi:hypothetical protein
MLVKWGIVIEAFDIDEKVLRITEKKLKEEWHINLIDPICEQDEIVVKGIRETKEFVFSSKTSERYYYRSGIFLISIVREP